jgi:hypothetical protein
MYIDLFSDPKIDFGRATALLIIRFPYKVKSLTFHGIGRRYQRLLTDSNDDGELILTRPQALIRDVTELRTDERSNLSWPAKFQNGVVSIHLSFRDRLWPEESHQMWISLWEDMPEYTGQLGITWRTGEPNRFDLL